MSFSDSEEDEGMVMLEASRYTGRADRISDHSPARKKRKLSNNHSRSTSASNASSSSSSPSFNRIQPTLPPINSRRTRNINTNHSRRSSIIDNPYPPRNVQAINDRQRGLNIHVTQRPNPNQPRNPLQNVINLTSSDSDSDDYDDSDDLTSSDSDSNFNSNINTMINPRKRSRRMISGSHSGNNRTNSFNRSTANDPNSIGRRLQLQTLQRRRDNMQYNDDSSSSSSSSPPTGYRQFSTSQSMGNNRNNRNNTNPRYNQRQRTGLLTQPTAIHPPRTSPQRSPRIHNNNNNNNNKQSNASQRAPSQSQSPRQLRSRSHVSQASRSQRIVGSNSNSSASPMIHGALSQPILPLSTTPVYHFGDKRFDTPLNINPGAIVRLELVNFLCHSNFSITFHPNINIISGQNGSGKSAIEAGISMALGTSAKKTMRGNTVRDVIKFNQDFAKIRLFLHNRGPEALREYGPEICIERKLSTAGKNGTSSFKVLDSNLKTIGNGMRAVRDIAERLNIHVDNPCVVLKQEAAKQFLNSAKERDKYRFFMQASKLGDFVEVLRESMDNVDIALEQQKQTKESFGLIEQQYKECKRNYDNLISIKSQEKLINFYIRSEKWMKYHKKSREVNRARNKAEGFKNKVIRGRATFEKQKHILHESVKKATEMKKQIENDNKKVDEVKAPINNIKKELKSLEKRRRELIRKKSAKQKLIDRGNKKIRDYNQEIQSLNSEMLNDERGKKLQEITKQLGDFQQELYQHRNQLPQLLNEIEPSIKQKENESYLERKENIVNTKEYEIKNIRAELKKLRSHQTSSAELFCPSIAQRNHVTIQQIRQLISYNKRKFRRVPVGPIGEFISVKDHDIITGNTIDKKTQDKYIASIQAALGNIITNFLVETSADQQLFRKLCYQKFKIVIPCIQYAYDDKRYNVCSNPFSNYQINDNNGPLLRISDLFDIKQTHDRGIASWIFNTIITSTQCERCYAYGTLAAARKFISSLSDDRLRQISCIYTYLEERIYKVSRRGQSVSGSPVQQRPPVIGADTTRLTQHYQQMLQNEVKEKLDAEKEVNQLNKIVNEQRRQLTLKQNQLRNVRRNIGKLEATIDRLIQQKGDLEDDNERNQSQERISELQNNINDENLTIQQYTEEIAPYSNQIEEIIGQEKERNNNLSLIEKNVLSEQSKVTTLKEEFQRFLDEIKKERGNIEKIPDRLRSLEGELNEQLKIVENEEKEMANLLDSARQCGDQVTPDQFPCKPLHMSGGGRFKLNELILYRKKIQASIQEWRYANNNPTEIIQRFEAIKPKYEQHQEAVRKCNNNVDAMNLVLHERRREYKKMKECVTEQLNTEFRYVMRQQAHDGNLEVDFERGKLNLKVIMASHDRFDSNKTQHVVNSKTLSGGEKSFTQIALIMALQKFCGTPMCIYDEFDVFMDSVNRGNSIKILLKTAIKNGGDRQYIFITPHDVSPMMDRRYRDMIRIHKLDAPRPDR